MDVKTRLQEITRSRYGQGLSLCSDRQLDYALLQYTQELSQGRPAPKGSGSCTTSPPNFSSASC